MTRPGSSGGFKNGGCLLLLLILLASCPSPRVHKKPLETIPGAAASQPTNKPSEDIWAGRTDLIPTPGVRAARALQIPALDRFELDNGLPVLVMPDRQLPLISVHLVLRVGNLDEPADRVGLADFTSSMLRQGTRRMKADAISQAVDAAGVSLAASSSYELTEITCYGRSQHVALCLKMVSDLALNPTFPKKEMAEVRDRLLTSVKQIRDDPKSLAAAHFDNLLYGDDHPGGRAATEASIRRVTREDLLRFHKRHFVPGAAVLGITGAIDPGKMKRMVRRVFRPWRKGPVPTRGVKPVQDPRGMKVLLVDKPDLSQSFFTLGHAGINRTHEDRDAISVMNYVLGGGGFSSRLMKVVRSEGGKTYGVSSSYYKSTHDGSFSAASFTRNEQLLTTIQMIQKELTRIAAAPPTDAEIRGARGKIAGGYAIRLPTTSAIARRLIRAQIRGLPDSFIRDFPLRIDRVTRPQVIAAAKKHVRPGRLAVAIVGQASKVAPQLRAAKIPFTQISYLDPINARDRTLQKTAADVKISPAEMTRARRVLEKTLKVAGGRRRLARVKSLRLKGKARVEAFGQTMEGSYSASILLPDHMRLALALKTMNMIQVLAGDRAYVQVGPQKKDLPAAVVQRMKSNLWREPALLPLHVLGGDARCRIHPDRKLTRGGKRVVVEVYRSGETPMTLVIDRRSSYLLEVQHKNRGGDLRITRLKKHRKVSGILVPHQVSAVIGSRTQTVNYTTVEINPRINKKTLLGGS